MAGEWIKVEVSTPDKPEVLRLARVLNTDPDVVLGKLIRMWAWFDRNSVDGAVDGVVAADVDALVKLPGFSAAVSQVGWLLINEDKQQLSLPNFDHHNGETAKKRALKNKRQANWRSRSRSAAVDERASTHASTREEKRREELNLTPPSPPAGKNGNGNGEHRERKKPATRVPDAFEITERMWSWAQEQGVQHERIEKETEKFLDHHKAKGSLFSDWPAAWRKWMRNVVDFAARAN